MPKKVDPVRLSFVQTDGSIVTDDYYAELNNCVFAGDISGCQGTFRGQFSARAVNVVHNPTIAGRATAITVAVEHAGELALGQNVWQRLAYASILIPDDDVDGGYLLAAFKYRHRENAGTPHEDEKIRIFQERVMIGSQPIFNVQSSYATVWTIVPLRYNEYCVRIDHPGLITVSIEHYYPDEGHNVHPRIDQRFVRVDYIRR